MADETADNLKMVKESQLRELQELAFALEDKVAEILDGSATLEDVFRQLVHGVGGDAEEDEEEQPELLTHEGIEYEVRRGGLSYSDVAYKEMGSDVFTLDEAWDRLKSKIRTKKGEPVRSSLNRAMKRDDRFAYHSEGKTVWFQKMPADELRERFGGEAEEENED